MENIKFESKRTPYQVLDGFFEDFRGKLSQRIEKENRKRRSWILGISSSVAAAVAIIVTFSIAINSSSQDRLYEQEIAALAESPEKYMSDEKLEAWVDFYENDLFINAQYSN